MFLGSIVGSDSYYICPPVILVVSKSFPGGVQYPVGGPDVTTRACYVRFAFIFDGDFYFPALWTSGGNRCRSFSLPGMNMPSFLSHIGFYFSVPTAHLVSSNVADARSRASRQSNSMQEKVSTSTYVHSVTIEPAYLILVGTRTTYQANRDLFPYGNIAPFFFESREFNIV